MDGRIVLYAQRIEVLNGREGLRYEVLVRLIDANGVVYTPENFLPAAERFGEAISIDRLVISMALRQLEDNPEHLEMLDLCHLNVSAQSIENPDFRNHVVNLLDSSRVPAEKLCFELTETAAIGNITRAREFIDEMRARGCRIALDDFGSGMSSFAYLKNLAVDVLKIDGVFVRDLANNEVDPVLVKSMCEVARSLGKTTVAEWVEDRQLLERLRNLGVDQAQGYGIHLPCALSELIASHQAAVRHAWFALCQSTAIDIELDRNEAAGRHGYAIDLYRPEAPAQHGLARSAIELPRSTAAFDVDIDRQAVATNQHAQQHDALFAATSCVTRIVRFNDAFISEAGIRRDRWNGFAHTGQRGRFSRNSDRRGHRYCHHAILNDHGSRRYDRLLLPSRKVFWLWFGREFDDRKFEWLFENGRADDHGLGVKGRNRDWQCEQRQCGDMYS